MNSPSSIIFSDIFVTNPQLADLFLHHLLFDSPSRLDLLDSFKQLLLGEFRSVDPEFYNSSRSIEGAYLARISADLAEIRNEKIRNLLADIDCAIACFSGRTAGDCNKPGTHSPED